MEWNLSILIAVWMGASSAQAADQYPDFATLSAVEQKDIDYRIDLQDRGAKKSVLAIHGGEIEGYTSEIAAEIAGSEWNLYRFEGIKPQGNRALHITSTHFDEPQALELAAKSTSGCLSIHGYKDEDELSVCVGGRDGIASQQIAKALLKISSDRFNVEYPCERFPGKEPANIVNRCGGSGVQLEFSGALRNEMEAKPELFKDVVDQIREAWAPPKGPKSKAR